MQTNFNILIDSFLENNIGIDSNFLNSEISNGLIENILIHEKNNLFKKAGIGNNTIAVQDNLFRSDKIFWIDRLHENKFENLFLDVIDKFIIYLNTTCYTSITGYEFHYAIYEKGNFYKPHLDQFANNTDRKYSMIMYLNKNWVLGDGGELCVHHLQKKQKINPTIGKCVFFESSKILHEVLETNVPRLSITGWLKV